MNEQTLRQHAHPAFRFLIDVGGDTQGVFTECTLPSVEWEVEEVKEGGLNAFTHQLPGRRKGTRVTLKNGVGAGGLMSWYLQTMTGNFERRSITINLLDSQMKTIMTWVLEDALPVKWAGPDLKASDNAIAIQLLEFAGGEVAIT
ncbi:MAG TPA: phage tail protein [Promineifilum sp.]|nr:phage tail protein [Promineifilum sp.]